MPSSDAFRICHVEIAASYREHRIMVSCSTGWSRSPTVWSCRAPVEATSELVRTPIVEGGEVIDARIRRQLRDQSATFALVCTQP
jgi:hypothetical protein